ncbi:MAG TPA: universal stress protein [Magnetospirillum sp.]|jgi:nucleotide-binding universal stress UspA family protein|nr:universal stress protein [Magnetospirillum sp.]
MYRHVLLAYDGTREGACALRQGAELAQATGAEVTLLAVIPARPGVLIAEAVGGDLLGHEQELYGEVLELGLELLAKRGLRAEGKIAYGIAIDEIVKTARAVGADLIVVGHRRKGRLAQWWSGSVGGTLLAQAPCSLLIAVEEGESA